MKILIACEHSQSVAEQFILKGHDVLSCDLYPGDKGYNHHQGDVTPLLKKSFDLIIAFPPCTYLAAAQIHKVQQSWLRWMKKERAKEFVRRIYESAPKVAIENPIGLLNSEWRQPEQILQPYQFGDPYKKDICLWLRGLMPLIPTHQLVSSGSHQAVRSLSLSEQILGDDSQGNVQGRAAELRETVRGVTGDIRRIKLKTVKNHVNSRMTGEERRKIKSNWKYFPLLSKAMADQWG